MHALLCLLLLAFLAAVPAAAAPPGCGFDECTAAQGCRVLLCSTLDNAAETAAPDVGPNAVGLTTVDFVGGVVDQGLRANKVGEYAAYPQIGTNPQGATVRSIENTRGTLDFWYQPNYDETDPGEYFIITNAERRVVSGSVTPTPSSLEILKHSSLGNGNSLAIIYWDGVATETLPNGQVIPKRWEYWVDPRDYELRAGVFTRFRVTWDWTSSGVPLRVWQDGKELPLQRADGGPAWKGPMGVAPESPNESLYICGRPAGTGGALFKYNGVCDQVRVYDRPIAPSLFVPPPTITSPAPGATLPGASVPFAWAANGTAASEWWLQLGSQPGANDLFNSGNVGSATQVVASGLPTNGSTVHARLFWRAAGPGSWSSADFQYTAANVAVVPPAITAPAPGSNLSGANVPFKWAANGQSPTEWWLQVGSQPGASDLFDSGSVGGATQISVSGLPTDGSLVYARLFWRSGGGSWSSADFPYTAANLPSLSPAIVTPAPGSTLAGTSLPFTWAANGAPASEWWLYVGSTPGANDYADSGNLGAQTQTVLNGLPGDGRPLHARLFWRAGSAGPWSQRDFRFAATALPQPGITNPSPASTLTGATVPFTWTDNGTPATEWWLYLGSSQGASDYHDSGSLGSATQTTVSGLPTEGALVFARLFWRVGGASWTKRDFVYAGATVPPPSIVSPSPGTTLNGATEVFGWMPNGTLATEWWLYAGSSPGASDYHDSGSLGAATQTLVNGLPTNGSPVHVRLFWRVGAGAWDRRDYSYTASPVP